LRQSLFERIKVALLHPSPGGEIGLGQLEVLKCHQPVDLINLSARLEEDHAVSLVAGAGGADSHGETPREQRVLPGSNLRLVNSELAAVGRKEPRPGECASIHYLA